MSTQNDLIEALTLMFSKIPPDSYAASKPFHCEHDELTVNPDIKVSLFTDEEIARLDELGFSRKNYDPDANDDEYPYEPEDDHFYSFRYGSC